MVAWILILIGAPLAVVGQMTNVFSSEGRRCFDIGYYWQTCFASDSMAPETFQWGVWAIGLLLAVMGALQLRKQRLSRRA